MRYTLLLYENPDTRDLFGPGSKPLREVVALLDELKRSGSSSRAKRTRRPVRFSRVGVASVSADHVDVPAVASASNGSSLVTPPGRARTAEVKLGHASLAGSPVSWP